jgi:cephalosporin hydroxylase
MLMARQDSFEEFVQQNIANLGNDSDFKGLTNIWLREAIRHNYAQNFSWLGRPIIQVPQDIYALQEVIWQVKPDLIIETGIAHGGSLIMSASMLALLDYCEAAVQGGVVDPGRSNRSVLGIDIDIRAHNRAGIEGHPLAHLIEMIEGSSIDSDVVSEVKALAKGYDKILVCLDSNHTHDHVLSELEAYAPLTSLGSYCIVWDTGVEDLPKGFCKDRPWDKGNNPKTAVYEYLRIICNGKSTAMDGKQLKFEINKEIHNKLMITAAPDGFLKRVG